MSAVADETVVMLLSATYRDLSRYRPLRERLEAVEKRFRFIGRVEGGRLELELGRLQGQLEMAEFILNTLPARAASLAEQEMRIKGGDESTEGAWPSRSSVAAGS